MPQRAALERPFTSDGGHAFIARIPEGIQERIERGAEAYVGGRDPASRPQHKPRHHPGGGRRNLFVVERTRLFLSLGQLQLPKELPFL